jgi:hypothetical protein
MSYAQSQRTKAQAELELRRRIASRSPYARYQTDPNGYAEDVLRVRWWSKQQAIAESLIRPPYRTLVKACHNVGKTYLGGSLVNWYFDSYAPSITLTTAPTARQVKDLLWKEVRVQRKGRGGFPGPKAPRMEWSADHFAHGFTATDGDAFQGHHLKNMFFVFDEAVGVDPVYWETAESMFGGEGHAWLAIFNPTDTSSQAYAEELSGGWHVISLSVLEHPNIAAELAGLPPPYPSAIRLARVDTLIKKWCRPVSGPVKATDIEWPPQSGTFYRPGPVAEARLLGRWPSQATDNVWSDGAWQVSAERRLVEPKDVPIQIGCDVARFGDDWTEIHVRRGPVSLHHEGANGWDTGETAGRLKELCGIWGRYSGQEPRDVLTVIDDDGVGGGVTDQRDGYNFVGLSAGDTAIQEEDYPNRRSELWFTVAEMAMENRLDLSRLDPDTLRELRRQAMAPIWKMDSAGRRVVEPKDQTKKRIKRSPDGMDALNLSYSVPRRREAKAKKIGVWRR